jgi:formate hydrogenlyase subunit 3/multisubunit Na+/H+ antiporter MnhD subunit
MLMAGVVVLPILAALGYARETSERTSRAAAVVVGVVVVLAAAALMHDLTVAAAIPWPILGVSLELRPVGGIALCISGLVVLATLAIERERAGSALVTPSVLLGLAGIALISGLSGNATAVGGAIGIVAATLIPVVVEGPLTTVTMQIGRNYLTWTTLAASALVLSDVLDRLYARQPGPGLLGAAAGLFVVGVGIIVGALPQSLWLPRIAEESPRAAGVVSTLLTSSATVAVAGALSADPWLLGEASTLRVVVAVGMFGSLLAAIFALGERNPARVFALLVSSNAGFAIAALAASPRGETSGVVWLLSTQALAAGLGFCCLGAAEGKLVSLFWHRPLVAVGLWTGAMVLAGLPLTAGFVGRVIAVSSVAQQQPDFLIVAGATGVVAGLVVIRGFAAVFERSDRTGEAITPFDVIVAVMSLALVLAGIFPGPILTLLQ